MAQESQRALSTDCRCGSICWRRNLSWVLDTKLWAGGLVTSQTYTAWTWPIALNFSHTRYFSCEGLGAKLGELDGAQDPLRRASPNIVTCNENTALDFRETPGDK